MSSTLVLIILPIIGGVAWDIAKKFLEQKAKPTVPGTSPAPGTPTGPNDRPIVDAFAQIALAVLAAKVGGDADRDAAIMKQVDGFKRFLDGLNVPAPFDFQPFQAVESPQVTIQLSDLGRRIEALENLTRQPQPVPRPA